MTAAILGVFAGALTQLKGELTEEEYDLTLFGLVLLALSALLQAMETMLENRLFVIEPDLSAFTMQTAVALWKLIMVAALVPFMGKIPAPANIVEGGKMENLERTWEELS